MIRSDTSSSNLQGDRIVAFSIQKSSPPYTTLESPLWGVLRLPVAGLLIAPSRSSPQPLHETLGLELKDGQP